jgi:hypothetical protein
MGRVWDESVCSCKGSLVTRLCDRCCVSQEGQRISHRLMCLYIFISAGSVEPSIIIQTTATMLAKLLQAPTTLARTKAV